MWLVFDARFICKWVKNYCPLYEGKLKNKKQLCFREDPLCLSEYPFKGLWSPRTKMNKRRQQGQWKKTSWSRDKMWEDCDWCDEAQCEKQHKLRTIWDCFPQGRKQSCHLLLQSKWKITMSFTIAKNKQRNLEDWKIFKNNHWVT